MSLVTHCPQCGLLFQVPRDRLAQAHEAVQCSQCDHVLEGKAFAIPAPVSDAPEQPQSLWDAPRVDVKALLRRKDDSAESVAVETSPMPMRSPGAAKLALTKDAKDDATDARDAGDANAGLAPAVPASASSIAGHALRRAVALDALPGVWWYRSMALILACGLVVQALIFFKDEFAAQFPLGQTQWAALCPFQACQAAPMRRWHGIVIDSASLVRSDSAYTLNVTLRNAQTVPLATTAIELSLTDAQDRVLVRRVLSPDELGAPAQLAAGQTWARSWSVEPASAWTEIAGYRLVSFYP